VNDWGAWAGTAPLLNSDLNKQILATRIRAMDEQISRLNDRTAIRVLSEMPETWPSEDAGDSSLGPEQQEALAQWLGAPVNSSPVSEGDLARQTLTLLATDPLRREAIVTLAQDVPSTANQFDAGATIAIGAAVLLVLQTYIRFERDKDGKWSVEIRKDPTDNELLKPVVAKFLSFLSTR
jgi:hypothetical protein